VTAPAAAAVAAPVNRLSSLAKTRRGADGYGRGLFRGGTIMKPFLLLTLLVSSAADGSTGAGSLHPLTNDAPRPLPLNVSLVPPLSVNAPFGYRTANFVALDLLVGSAAALEGVELSGVGSRNGVVRGVQLAGVGNWVASGAYEQSGDARGAQLAGVLNWTGGSVRGAQLAGALNAAGRDSAGVQLAGAVNLASTLAGLQAAGAVNAASAVRGLQIAGAVNWASEAAGIQLAPVNVTGRVHAAQLGVVNVAEDAEVSVGAFSWVRNGTHDVTVAATEYGVLTQLDTGGRTLYGILAAGTVYDSRPRRYLLGFGLGWRALATSPVVLDVQATALQMVDAGAWTERRLCSARAVAAVRLAGPVSVFAGPTFNVFVDSEPQKISAVGYGWKVGSGVQLWPGVLAGLRLF
jgi:hypothetical protein